MRHILGIILIATPFITIFVLSADMFGLRAALGAFGVALVVAAMITVGVHLLDS